MYTKIYILIYLLGIPQIFLANNSNVIHVIYVYYTINKKFFSFKLHIHSHDISLTDKMAVFLQYMYNKYLLFMMIHDEF